MYEVLDGLYLASFADVSRRGREARDYFIINCSKDLPMLSPTGVRIPVDDSPSENGRMLNFFTDATRLIHNRLRAGDEIIVHCWAGQQRSAAVVAAYLMKWHGLSRDQAKSYVRGHNPDAFLDGATFDPALKTWENST